MNKFIIRVAINPETYIINKDDNLNKYGIKWDNKGLIKYIYSADDFIFKSPSIKKALQQLSLIEDLNPGLILDINITSLVK